MDELVYNALDRYFHALELKGYMPDSDVQKVLLLSFYNDFMSTDYRGYITEEDHNLIWKALDCLFGSSCLIPYPEYKKMGHLELGSISELANRTQKLEDQMVGVQETKVLKSKGKVRDINDINT